jgi:hypothetical protein
MSRGEIGQPTAAADVTAWEVTPCAFLGIAPPRHPELCFSRHKNVLFFLACFVNVAFFSFIQFRLDCMMTFLALLIETYSLFHRFSRFA